MEDPTESTRRRMVADINANAGNRATLEAEHGTVWDTDELGRDFEVIGFLAPFVVVRRKSDGKRAAFSSSTARDSTIASSKTTDDFG